MEQPAPDISHLEDITRVLSDHRIDVEPASFAGWNVTCAAEGCGYVVASMEPYDTLLAAAIAKHATEVLAGTIAQREKQAAATELRRSAEFIVRPKHPGLDRETLHEVYAELTARADDIERENH